MREAYGIGGLLVLMGLATPAWAQQRDPSSFMTGVRPQDIVFQKIIDVPEAAAPQVQPRTVDRFSFRQMLSKVFPFVSPSTPPSFATAVPLLPGANVSTPFQPSLPRFTLPPIPGAHPFPPSLPRTTLPNIGEGSTLKPVLPIP
jgi:hypothetical protein